MNPRKHLRRRAAAIVLAVVAVLALSLPGWWPWVLRAGLRTQGVQFSRFERTGFARLMLHEVRFREGRARFTAERVETATPPLWLWRQWIRNPAARPVLAISQWELTFDPAPPVSESGGSLHDLLNDLEWQRPRLHRWLPGATAHDGLVKFGENRIEVSELNWQNQTLTGRGSWPPYAFGAHVRLAFNQEKLSLAFAELTLTLPANELTTQLTFSRHNDLPQAQGFVQWRSNHLDLTAQFGRAGWWPDVATARARTFHLAEPELQTAGYNAVTGSVELQWWTNRFVIDLKAQAQPDQTNRVWRPTLAASARVSGDLLAARIEQASLVAPGLSAQLAEPIEMNFAGRLRDEPASLRLALDLAQFPGLSATGRVDGVVTLKRTDERRPTVEFDLSAGTLTALDLATETARASGQLDWPALAVSELSVRLTDGSELAARGSADLSTRQFTQASVELTGPFAHRWLPEGFAYDSLSFTGQVSGSFNQPAHTGRLVVDGLRSSNLPPALVTATWRGEALKFHNAEIRAASPDWSLELGGSLDATARQFDAQFATGSVTRSNATLARLIPPGRIVVQPASTTNDWIISASSFNWRGIAGELALSGHVSWPKTGTVAVALRGIEPAGWLPAVAAPWRELLIEAAEISAAWTNGPVKFLAAAAARIKTGETTALRGELRLTGDGDGLQIERTEVFDGAERAFTASGQVPVTLEPTRGADWIQPHPELPLSFELATQPGGRFWDQFARWTGVRLHKPEGTLSLHGTLAHPQGKLMARASAAEIQTVGVVVPQSTDLRAAAEFTPTNVTLTTFTALVEGQPVRINGSVPLNEGFWKRPFRPESWLELEKASGRVEMTNANVAAFARFLPEMLSPQGEVDLDLTVRPGLMLAGQMSLTNAATRGWLPMGPIRDVQARFRFVERRAEIERFTGQLAGGTVNVTGQFGWPVRGRPEFALKLSGQRVPLAREPGLILRADVDLALTATNPVPPVLTGTLRLRDSFYLAELRSLLPGRTATPQLRPPYFSITEEPFAHWKLDVRVTGERGLRVRTPLFRGEVTPNLRLGGVLREPFAVGEVRVEEGRVQFPFASLKIEQGRVALAADNPYRPELFIAATSRSFDYDVRLHVTGFADAPEWELSSHPPLSPEAIVLLITTGEVPRETITFTDRQRAGRLMFFLGKSLFAELWLEESAAERLVIRSGESVTRDGRETYAVEYLLTDRWSLVGEYDQFNAVNAGIKWRVYSK